MVSGPIKDHQKKHWTGSELALAFGVTAQGLRFYEQRGLLAPGRVEGARAYDYRDHARLVMIQKFRRLGFSLSEIADYFSHYRSGGPNAPQHRDGLAKIEARLAALRRMQDELEETIAELEQMRVAESAQLAEAEAQEKT